jgi:hypothetical protein
MQHFSRGAALPCRSTTGETTDFVQAARPLRLQLVTGAGRAYVRERDTGVVSDAGRGDRSHAAEDV